MKHIMYGIAKTVLKTEIGQPITITFYADDAGRVYQLHGILEAIFEDTIKLNTVAYDLETLELFEQCDNEFDLSWLSTINTRSGSIHIGAKR